MLIVVMMGWWSDVHDVRMYSKLNTVVISGEEVCCLYLVLYGLSC